MEEQFSKALPKQYYSSTTRFPQTSCLNPVAQTASDYGKCSSLVSEFARRIVYLPTGNAERNLRVHSSESSLQKREDMRLTIHRCENESNFCNGMNNGDTWNDLADSWHSACDSRITFSPTTPALSTYSSIDILACSTAWDGCISQSAEVVKCRTFSTQESQLTSCMCRPAVLSAAFTCSYYANVSCQLVPATLSNVAGYEYCSGFMDVVGVLANVSNTDSVSSADHEPDNKSCSNEACAAGVIALCSRNSSNDEAFIVDQVCTTIFTARRVNVIVVSPYTDEEFVGLLILLGYAQSSLFVQAPHCRLESHSIGFQE
ncbi:uncharacterized protein BDR25DRAFT_352228 [Lindgomyces ingoldianus]|uniref:Uncharacterized protein n=1 Tax=Lindgomyces ingoldianus TaxID=673940 RepID=A0ACB6R389_9PLEO|nr:uncharacterized protein BDR25DRAFT_352228 [Lindgomyces ingoldianus]KAF2473724.1 hypothetical protein BDR25DRAFT_352228 [Lindgomyces ingoldianus]